MQLHHLEVKDFGRTYRHCRYCHKRTYHAPHSCNRNMAQASIFEPSFSRQLWPQTSIQRQGASADRYCAYWQLRNSHRSWDLIRITAPTNSRHWPRRRQADTLIWRITHTQPKSLVNPVLDKEISYEARVRFHNQYLVKTHFVHIRCYVKSTAPPRIYHILWKLPVVNLKTVKLQNWKWRRQFKRVCKLARKFYLEGSTLGVRVLKRKQDEGAEKSKVFNRDKNQIDFRYESRKFLTSCRNWNRKTFTWNRAHQ